MAVYHFADPGFFDKITPDAMRYSRDLGHRAGLELGTLVLGDDPVNSPAAMVLQLPPGHTLDRHAHGCHRVEVVIRGSLQMPDGITLTPGDVLVSRPDEFYGPHVAGPDGVLTVEIFSSAAGFAPVADESAPEEAKEMLTAIRAATARAQAGA
jgi:hypothetical protein